LRYVSLDRVVPGMKPAYDLLDDHGRVLVGVQGTINESYIERLYQYGFSGIYIDDAFSEDIEIDSPIPPALKAKGMDCVKRLDVDGCKAVAMAIVETLMNNPNISMNIQDLRCYDNYTYAHSMNVAVLSGAMGIGLGMNGKELGYLVTAALLHDLGKLMIPEPILNKKGRLTAEEYSLMKSHALMSYDAIRNRDDLSAHIKVAVRHHHENVDGTGYPDGVKGDKLTIYAKILHVADVYDALTSKRPYKQAYSTYEALEYLMGNCGTQFDMGCVHLLMKYVPLYPKGIEVELSNGVTGIIYNNNGAHNMRPVIKTFDEEFIDLLDFDNLSLTVVKTQGKEIESIEAAEERRRDMVDEEGETRNRNRD